MKITGIETLPVSVGPGYDYAVLIVLVRTDEGLTGIGEASLAGQGRGVLGILDHAAELLVGQDATRIEHWWSELVRGTFWSTGQVIMSAVAGIDIALWDLQGKRLGVPVYELLGGPTRERVRVYRHLAGDSAEELVEDALRWREQGFTALRYGPLAAFDAHSLANWDPQRSIVQTIAATESLRGALGDEVDLLLDAHTMFSPAESAYLGHALEPYRLFFYEDPIRPLNPHSLRLVRDKVNLPLATGEQLAHKWEFQPLIEDGARRLPAHRPRARRRHHGGEEDPRRRGDARAALGAPPRELAGERRRVPPCRPGGAELRHPGVDGARAALRALPERTARRGRLRLGADGTRPRPRARRGGGTQAPLSGRPPATAPLARRRRRGLLTQLLERAGRDVDRLLETPRCERGLLLLVEAGAVGLRR